MTEDDKSIISWNHFQIQLQTIEVLLPADVRGGQGCEAEWLQGRAVMMSDR